MSAEERENFNQNGFFMKQLLKLDTNHVYVEEDLINKRTLT